MDSDLEARAARHAALGDPVRLQVVDELLRSDRAPIELRHLLGIESNLLTHHLDVLERVGLVRRSTSTGDARRRYLHLVPEALGALTPRRAADPTAALFVCTQNSARSQLAAALWRSVTGAPADSAGTHPAAAIHPGALAAAGRAGLELRHVAPKPLSALRRLPPLVVTVCDQAHEELHPDPSWLHWSLPDPVATTGRGAFDRTVRELRDRIHRLVTPLEATS